VVKEFSRKLAGCLVENRVIEEKDTGIYEYGLSLLIYNTINLATVLLIGGFLRCIWESLCYMVCFLILRKFTGGYHARSPVACYFISICLFGASICFARFYTVNVYLFAVVLILALPCGCIVPVETKNKTLSVHEMKVYRIISLIVFLLEVSLAVVAWKISFPMLYTSIVMAIFGCELLAITGYLHNRRNRRIVSEPE